jgi:hypothetical protein
MGLAMAYLDIAKVVNKPSRILAVLAALALGCNDATNKLKTVGSTSDSSSVTRITGSPALTIGSIEGAEELQFTEVSSAFKTNNGLVIAANKKNPPELRIFDSRGDLIAKTGRKGSGPGEFREITWVRERGDTLIAYDVWLSRLTYYTGAGSFIKTANAPVGGGYKGSYILLGVLPDGSGLARPNLMISGNPKRNARALTPVVHFKSDTSRMQRILEFPDADFVLQSDPRLGQRPVRPIFGLEAPISLIRNRLLIGAADEFRITEYDPSVQVRQVYSRPFTRRTVTKADIRAQQVRAVDKVPIEYKKGVAKYYKDTPHNRYMPIQHPDDWTLLVDAKDRLWSQEYLAPTDKCARWSVFEPSGRYIGDVEVPANVRIMQIGLDYILGAARDQLGIESVVVYSFSDRKLKATDSKRMN